LVSNASRIYFCSAPPMCGEDSQIFEGILEGVDAKNCFENND
jgi:hypothetical protein